MHRYLYFILVSMTIVGCHAPRAVNESGRVTPHKHVKVNFGTTTNAPGAFAKQVINILSDGIGDVKNDTFQVNENINDLTGAILTYTLDPLTQTFDFYMRYGIAPNFDLGYKYTGGVHAFDTQYQIAGPEAHNNSFWGEKLYSSIGLQYSQKKYKLPSIIGDLQDILGYKMERKDLFLKWINSLSFGDEEKYGHFGFGLAYNHTFVKYGLSPSKVMTYIDEYSGGIISRALAPLPEGKNNYGSYGGFVNIRGGYQYVYVYFSFSAFYQNYGKYYLFDQYEFKAKGWTFIPSFGIQFDL